MTCLTIFFAVFVVVKKNLFVYVKKKPKLKKKDTILSGQKRYDSSGRNAGREYIYLIIYIYIIKIEITNKSKTKMNLDISGSKSIHLLQDDFTR